MKDGISVAGVEVSASRVAGPPGIFTEDTPAAPRVWRCQHCGAAIVGKVLASFNGAPLCLGDRDDDSKPNCYRRVSMLNHQMPCLGVPCPGDVPMEHDHGDHAEEPDAEEEREAGEAEADPVSQGDDA